MSFDEAASHAPINFRFNNGRKQYLASDIMEVLRRTKTKRNPRKELLVVGIMIEDIYPSESKFLSKWFVGGLLIRFFFNLGIFKQNLTYVLFCFAEDNWDFVYGMSSISECMSLWSVARLDPIFPEVLNFYVSSGRV
jgi:hypothetical protein